MMQTAASRSVTALMRTHLPVTAHFFIRPQLLTRVHALPAGRACGLIRLLSCTAHRRLTI
jgi:hypothetical protein